MRARILHSLVLAAALTMLAATLHLPSANAINAPCCCTAEACRCNCCSAHHGKSELPAAFQDVKPAASGDCSCSSGPNPFGRDAAQTTIYLELQKKRLLNSAVFFAPGHCFTPALSASVKDKPPPRSIQGLYLLKSSLRI